MEVKILLKTLDCMGNLSKFSIKSKNNELIYSLSGFKSGIPSAISNLQIGYKDNTASLPYFTNEHETLDDLLHRIKYVISTGTQTVVSTLYANQY